MWTLVGKLVFGDKYNKKNEFRNTIVSNNIYKNSGSFAEELSLICVFTFNFSIVCIYS